MHLHSVLPPLFVPLFLKGRPSRDGPPPCGNSSSRRRHRSSPGCSATTASTPKPSPPKPEEPGRPTPQATTHGDTPKPRTAHTPSHDQGIQITRSTEPASTAPLTEPCPIPGAVDHRDESAVLGHYRQFSFVLQVHTNGRWAWRIYRALLVLLPITGLGPTDGRGRPRCRGCEREGIRFGEAQAG
jgi:hypothetical protein